MATAEARSLFPLVDKLFSDLDEVRRLAQGLRKADGAKDVRVLTVLALSYEVFPAAVERFPGVASFGGHSPCGPALAPNCGCAGVAGGRRRLLFSAPSHPALQEERLASQGLVCVVPKGLLSPVQSAAGVLVCAIWQACPSLGWMPAIL